MCTSSLTVCLSTTSKEAIIEPSIIMDCYTVWSKCLHDLHLRMFMSCDQMTNYAQR